MILSYRAKKICWVHSRLATEVASVMRHVSHSVRLASVLLELALWEQREWLPLCVAMRTLTAFVSDERQEQLPCRLVKVVWRSVEGEIAKAGVLLARVP